MEGLEFDKGKIDWSVIPLEVIEPLVEVFMAGEAKYGFMNCLKDFENGDRRFFAAAMRHKVACQHDPLARDEETGQLHGYQDAWNMIMRTFHALKRERSPIGEIKQQILREGLPCEVTSFPGVEALKC